MLFALGSRSSRKIAEFCDDGGEHELVSHLTPLALDGAIAPDNQQILTTDVLVGEGTLPEPPASKA
jgi:hypothetical protein